MIERREKVERRSRRGDGGAWRRRRMMDRG